MSHTTRRGAAAMLAAAGAGALAMPAAPVVPETPKGTPQDFDFEHGNWRTSLRRRLKPLSGSDVWAEYAGTTRVSPVLDGRANLVELDVAGPQGRIQGLSLRLFEVQRQRWTLNFSNAASGELAAPMVGGFGGGPRGVFYSAEDFNGRSVLVRFVIESLTHGCPQGRATPSPPPEGVKEPWGGPAVPCDRCRFEQAFSADGGATWEVNWVAVDTRA